MSTIRSIATAQAEVDRVVREALARIPDRYRETLVLYYCENRSIREVAATLGIAEDAAMQRLSRGRRYLAAGVNELVERSLRADASTSKDLRMAVLAALPHVDAPSPPRGSNMLKLAIAAARHCRRRHHRCCRRSRALDVAQRPAPTTTVAAKPRAAAPTHAIQPPRDCARPRRTLAHASACR